MEESKYIILQYGFIKKINSQKKVQGLALKNLLFYCDDQGPLGRAVVYSKNRQMYESIRQNISEEKTLHAKGLGSSLEIRLSQEVHEIKEALEILVDFLLELDFEDDNVVQGLSFIKSIVGDDELFDDVGFLVEVAMDKDTIVIKAEKQLVEEFSESDKELFFQRFDLLLEKYNVGVLKEPMWHIE